MSFLDQMIRLGEAFGEDVNIGMTIMTLHPHKKYIANFRRIHIEDGCMEGQIIGWGPDVESACREALRGTWGKTVYRDDGWCGVDENGKNKKKSMLILSPGHE